ncbi:hypothetical protein CSQ80_14080 [Cyanobacterium aponinum IPPAS B-1201]|nr:hypothetical protein CSQ80_14080 [Cyanobacterium aponinum IPPAS B-1201]
MRKSKNSSWGRNTARLPRAFLFAKSEVGLKGIPQLNVKIFDLTRFDGLIVNNCFDQNLSALTPNSELT